MKLRALVLLLAAPAAAASGWEAPDRIRAVVSQYVAAQAPPGASIETRVAVDPNLRLPQCAEVPRPFAAGAGNRSAFTVGVSCAGPTPWTLYVPVRLTAQAEVLVLVQPLARGAAVTPEALRPERRDLGALPQGYFTDPARVLGQRLRHPLPAGAVLGPADVEAPAAVRRGQQVVLLGVRGPLEVRAQGKALADGAVNEVVRVQNLGSQRVVEGVVRSAGVVEVAF